MYTILINNDNTVIATERQRIMQRSKLVDTFQIIAPKFYEEYDMSKFTLYMEYITPISKTPRLLTLILKDDNYNDDFLLYSLPFDTGITAENGDVEIHFRFVGVFIGEDGVQMQRVRELPPYLLTVIPIQSWFAPPDEALDAITQQYIAIQQSIGALEDLADTLNQTKADNIKLDTENGNIHLTSNGQKIGDAINLEELGDELAEQTDEGLIKVLI